MLQRIFRVPRVKGLGLAQGFLLVSFLVVGFLVACDKAPVAQYSWQLPEYFPAPNVPDDNPMSQAKVQLGRYLFYDPQLSFNGSQSCSSCHIQALGFAENLATSVGSEGDSLHRNASSLINVGYNRTLTWAHPYLRTLERQVLIPMFSEEPIELGITGHEDEILPRFTQGDYPKMFTQAFGSPEPDFVRISYALASFVRSLISFDSPFDRYAFAGDDQAMTESEIRGMNLFFSEELECHHCHGGFNFTQSTDGHGQGGPKKPFHNIGLYNVGDANLYPEDDGGVYDVTKRRQDIGAFRAPTLRNVAVTGPYMHDGSVATLGEVIDIYAAGGRVIENGDLQGDGRENRYKSQFIKPFELSEQDRADLIAFLHALTDQSFLTNPEYSNPIAQASN